MAQNPLTPVVTRYAPSPTGPQHVGGARTALFSWAYARGRDGVFLLRSEDTDRKRSSAEAERAILADLKWLGLDWDNAGDVPRQSERLDLYNKAVDKLLVDGVAYEQDGAVRFRMDRGVAFHDEVYGEIEVKADELEDFVIRKGEAGGRFPTFHLAVVVDDAAMGVTHVIRGQEHLSNTPKHLALQEALGLPRPVYAHLPSIINADGSKMSKRDKAKVARAAALQLPGRAHGWAPPGATANVVQTFLDKEHDDPAVAESIAEALGIDLPEIEVADFRKAGYLPGVLCNYLALLGWNPGDDVERFDIALLREQFSFERVGRKNARFDREKLAEFNRQSIAELPADAYLDALRPFMPEHLDDQRFRWFAEATQERAKTLTDPARQNAYLFDDDTPDYPDPNKAIRKALLRNEAEGYRAMEAAREPLQGLGAWEPAAIQAALDAVANERGLKNTGIVAQPIRLAVSGGTVTPPIELTLAVLGQQRTLSRINACLTHYAPQLEPAS